jgi:peptidoglycan/xylan/chitin deacetylase (PgdA/CDA1 family)
MYFVKTPKIVQSLLPNCTWRIPGNEEDIYLTFDDGPIPQVTPWVLDQLDAWDAKATFFCVGHNVDKHPDIFLDVVDRGHRVGSHTYNHLDGWKTDNMTYFRNVWKGARKVESNLFRPPYGRMLPSQMRFLSRHYQVVMWDVLSGDFDAQLDETTCLENILKHVRPGSIIVLHDSIKSFSKLQYVLPRLLENLHLRGFQFKSIPGTASDHPAVSRSAGVEAVLATA